MPRTKRVTSRSTVRRSPSTRTLPARLKTAGAALSRGAARNPILLGVFVPSQVNMLATQLTAAFSRETERHGITVSEWRVLIALDAVSPQRLSDLAALTRLDLSTLSRLVRRLEARKLCRIAAMGRDKRIGHISLDQEGRVLLAALVPVGRAFEEGMLAGMKASERKACLAMLHKLSQNLGDFLAGRT